jgi:hypothetical protein
LKDILDHADFWEKQSDETMLLEVKLCESEVKSEQSF